MVQSEIHELLDEPGFQQHLAKFYSEFADVIDTDARANETSVEWELMLYAAFEGGVYRGAWRRVRDDASGKPIYLPKSVAGPDLEQRAEVA